MKIQINFIFSVIFAIGISSASFAAEVGASCETHGSDTTGGTHTGTVTKCAFTAGNGCQIGGVIYDCGNFKAISGAAGSSAVQTQKIK